MWEKMLFLNELSVSNSRYQGHVLEDGALESAVNKGAASPEFTKLCAWIVSELRLYCKLEENVHATNCKQFFFSFLHCNVQSSNQMKKY